jgi:hypothetical protein
MRLPGIDPQWFTMLQSMMPGVIAQGRAWLGWGSITIGVLGTILPIIPGLPFLIIGTHLIGHRDRKLRWLRVHSKLLLRLLAASRIPVVNTLAGLSRRMYAQSVRQIRMWRCRKGKQVRKPDSEHMLEEQPTAQEQPCLPTQKDNQVDISG